MWRAGAVALAVLAGIGVIPVSAAQPTEIADPKDDAYRYPGPLAYYEPKPPLAPLSNDAADMVSVKFAPAKAAKHGHDAAYSVSVTLDGAPHAAYNYLVGGQFGEDCYLIHFLRAGETRKAMASCGEGEKWRMVTEFEGSTVSIKGNTITATFSFRRFALPSSLKKSPEIKNLYAMSCPVTGKSWGCNDDVIDFAFTESSFKL